MHICATTLRINWFSFHKVLALKLLSSDSHKEVKIKTFHNDFNALNEKNLCKTYSFSNFYSFIHSFNDGISFSYVCKFALHSSRWLAIGSGMVTDHTDANVHYMQYVSDLQLNSNDMHT